MRSVIVFISAALAFSSGLAWCQQRIVLAVGNNAYLKIPSLSTAVNDANAVGSVLKSSGFDVI